MLDEETIKSLKKEWLNRLQNKGGIIYKYIQEELIDSFIEDIKTPN
ncbi:MAG: hypothetical protein ABIH25_00420 [Candidatus Woesearchaeota archaeon]